LLINKKQNTYIGRETLTLIRGVESDEGLDRNMIEKKLSEGRVGGKIIDKGSKLEFVMKKIIRRFSKSG